MIHYGLGNTVNAAGCSDSWEIVMGMAWTTGRITAWSHRSQERAVRNAREASTAMSRRVEREEVDLFLRSHAATPAPPGVRRPA